MSTEKHHHDRPAPRLQREIVEELNDLARIEEVLAAQTEDTASHRFRLKSLAKLQSDLHEELHASQLLESKNDFEFSVEGDPVKDHTVTADFLGKFLEYLQKLIDRVIFAGCGSSKMSDKIPDSSLLESRIRITGWRASSFTVEFKLTPVEEIGDFFVSDRRKAALRDLRMLFDDSTPDERLSELITRSSSRAAYRKILLNVANQKAIVKLRTKVDPYSAKLSAEIAGERSKWMEFIEKKPDRVLNVTGILVAGNIDAHTFRIRAKNSVYYWGPIAEDAQAQIQKIALGSNVNAMITEVTKYKTKADDKPIETHTLESIFEVKTEEEIVTLFDM